MYGNCRKIFKNATRETKKYTLGKNTIEAK